MPEKNTRPATPASFADDFLENGSDALDFGTFDEFLDAVPQPAAEYNEDGSRNRIGLDHDPTIRRPSPKRTLQRIGRERAALEQIERLPEAGEDLVLILTGRWHGFDLIGAVLNLIHPATIDRLEIATLGFNNAQTETLADLMDAGSIGTVRFLVSEMFRDKNKGEFERLQDTLETRRQTIGAARNHCKLILIETTDGRNFAIHGSLNLRRCNSFEQLEISTSPELHAFFREYISDALNGLQV